MNKNVSHNKKSKKTPYFNRRMKTKLVAVFIIFLAALFGLNFKLSYINMKSGGSYTLQVLAQQEYSRTLAFKRGDILDRNMVKLATSVKTYNLILDPKVILSKEEYLEPTLEALASCFSISKEDLLNIINEKSTSSYVVQLKNLSYEQTEDFLALQDDKKKGKNVKGVWFEEEYERKYPYSTLASDTIGFASASDSGAVGLELYYNEYLTGSNGREYGYMNSDNQMDYIAKPAGNGNSLVSTIDFNIQAIVEKHIQQYKTDYNPKNIAVVIADPNTGEILAMASDKGYDLNNPRDLSAYYTPEEISAMSNEQVVDNLNSIWSNYCVSETYEPGSTFKPVTIAAALEESKISKTDSYDCDGYQMIPGMPKPVYCHVRTGHGWLDVRGAIMQSCNDALMQMADIIGADIFCKYQNMFGFGQTTGIDLPQEATGLLHNAESMKQIDLDTSSFGQNFTVNMMQMTASFSSLINGGNYYEPHMVKQIVGDDGKVVENIGKTLVKQTVTQNTSDFLREALYATVTDGTGKTAAVEGYQVGGKTGTAEKIPRDEGRYLLSFLGFAPYENPQVVCYVIVDDPQVPDYSSSAYASKLFSQIMTEVLPYMGIYPE